MESKRETGEQMIERIRAKLENEPFPIMRLTKMQWGMIIGLLCHAKDAGLTDDDDVRWQTSLKLFAEVGFEYEDLPPVEARPALKRFCITCGEEHEIEFDGKHSYRY